MTNDTLPNLDKILPHKIFKDIRSELFDFIDSASAGDVAILFGPYGIGKKRFLNPR